MFMIFRSLLVQEIQISSNVHEVAKTRRITTLP